MLLRAAARNNTNNPTAKISCAFRAFRERERPAHRVARVFSFVQKNLNELDSRSNLLFICTQEEEEEFPTMGNYGKGKNYVSQRETQGSP